MSISRYRIIYYINEITTVMFLWAFCSFSFVYVKFNDIPETALAQLYGLEPWMDRFWLYRYSIITASIIGLIMGIMNTFLYPLIIKTGNFLVSITLRLVLFFLLAAASSGVFLFLSDFEITPLLHSGSSIMQKSVLDAFIFMIIIEIIVGILVTMRRHLGKNYFRKFIRNSYFVPKEEERVFIFTDLKNSTQLVEQLGGAVFSSFIQDCFRDFSDLALDHGGEIYQFVGDEVVTTWKIDKRFQYENCINLHFNFIKRLHLRSDYYSKKYGSIPEFWSSIHSGKVSAALVGQYKTEIAYHGGVLNLCSRLQSVCRQHNTDLVVSADFYWKLGTNNAYEYSPIANLELKGISDKQLVFKVLKATDSIN